MSIQDMDQKRVNTIVTGLLVGLILPIILFFGIEWLSEFLGDRMTDGKNAILRPRTVALFAICANILPFSYANKRKYSYALRGVVLATLLLSAVWMYLYFGELYEA